MSEVTEMVGRRYGRLVVKCRAPKRPELQSRSARWVCLCDCGDPNKPDSEKIEVTVSGAALRNESVKSCGCLQRESARRPTEEMIGRRYGELTIESREENDPNLDTRTDRSARWLCLCSCGRRVVVPTRSLESGRTTSCGHVQKEKARALFTKHGEDAAKVTAEVAAMDGEQLYQHQLLTLRNKQWMSHHYEVLRESTAEIAAQTGMSVSTVHAQLRSFGIPIRKNEGSSAPRPRAQFRDTIHNREWLYRHAVELDLPAAAIARVAGCSLNIAAKAVTKLLGKGKEGSPEQMERMKKNAARARTRYQYKEKQPCKLCGTKDKPTINHIDGDTGNDSADNLEWLCRSHHYMVDKRLAFRAVLWFRATNKQLWLQWHEEELSKIVEEDGLNADGGVEITEGRRK